MGEAVQDVKREFKSNTMNFKYSHFKPHISSALQNKIRCLCDAITPFIERWANQPELVTSWELEPIEGNHVSGWIPHQDGGFQILCFIDNGYSSGRYICEEQRDSTQNLLDCFRAEYGDDEENYNELHDWMSEPCMLFFRAFVEQGKIVMQYGFNSEAPHYREKYHTILKTMCMDEAEFMDSSIVNIVKELAE